MKYMKGAAIIFGISMVGELLNVLLPLPVPAGVYGLFLLLFLLCCKVVKVKDIEVTGNFLLDVMPMMFIPSCVGLIEQFEELSRIWLPLVVISLVSTVIVMAVTGTVAQMIQRGKQKGEKKAEVHHHE